MKRKAEQYLDHWHQKSQRKPLVIRGARQVGKSTLVRLFAQSKGLVLHEINLEKHSGIESIFASLDVKRILQELELIIGKGSLASPHALLFLDEIQAVPQAIKALRYLYEEKPELAVIAAGSLLEFTLSDAGFSMPVGRIEYCYLGPLSFEEYLEALNEAALLRYLEEYSPDSPVSPHAHGKLLNHLRDFFLVGGMPEAVAAFLEQKSLQSAWEVHRSILDTYRDDFSKYASKLTLVRLRRIFDLVPQAVGRKVIFSHFNKEWPARDVRAALDLLDTAGIIHCVHHSDGTGIPLNATESESVFKLLFLDIGLMHASHNLTAFTLEEMLTNRFINEGSLAEQFVGQHLLFNAGFAVRPELHYWLREGKQGNAEVDYLLQSGARIIPVEVKAGTGGSLRSLHQFVAARSSQIAFRFDTNPPSQTRVRHAVTGGGKQTQIDFKLVSLPLYMIHQARRLSEVL